MDRKALLVKECLRQEIAMFCMNIGNQVNLLAKVNGLTTKDYALIPREKGECLDSSLSDSWMAQYAGQRLEVSYQKIFKNTETPALLNIAMSADLSCLRFDCANRLWLCTTPGHIEILDVRRSIKLLAPVKYFMFKLNEKTIHSSLL